MRNFLFIVVLALLTSTPTQANERKVIFEGLDTKVETIRDTMTDETSGAMFFPMLGPIYIAIYRHDSFVIWARNEDLHFAFDSKHLIRVGNNKPFLLKYLEKRNGLTLTNEAEAELVIKSLVKGEKVKVRYYDWPHHEQFDEKIWNPNLSLIYDNVRRTLRWKDFGIKPKLAPVKLHVYDPNDTGNEGYASVSVVGNSELGLTKGSDKSIRGGCYLNVGIAETFGIQNGKWCCRETDRHGKYKLVIHDSQGNLVFSASLPRDIALPRDDGTIEGNPWPEGPKAAKAAWDAGSLGKITVEDIFEHKALLYGFRELWKWGQDNAGFPRLE